MLGRLREGLRKTREKFTGGLRSLLTLGRKLDEGFLEELEAKLLAADMGPTTALRLMEEVQEAYRSKEITTPGDVLPFLETRLLALLGDGDTRLRKAPQPPTVILVVGVNGSGKTTSIAKLARYLQQRGQKVILGAGDTFRAAAVEQLGVWAERLGVDLVRHQHGGDPAAVAFDTVEAALARGADAAILDTAGRLHTQKNLMAELEKMKRVVGKKVPGAPHEVLLVLDATVGQNAIRQAQEFRRAAGVTGIFLAKLDGTAKGGAVLGLRHEVPVPVKFVGLGEGLDDLEEFDPRRFVEALLA